MCVRVDALLSEEIATCDTVRMEILAGARDDRHLRDLRRLLARATSLATEPADAEEAALLYRAGRRAGETLRTLTDCQIAAVAIRAHVPVLHLDDDFEAMHRHTPLRVSRAHDDLI